VGSFLLRLISTFTRQLFSFLDSIGLDHDDGAFVSMDLNHHMDVDQDTGPVIRRLVDANTNAKTSRAGTAMPKLFFSPGALRYAKFLG